MALKDIFKMIKADRYTADGCEEIKKAQEAIAEDAGLPDGSMSHRKDGDYIKQAGKWVPAKRANGGAKKADKPNPNGVVAQQKQKMETEKHEAARRDAQAPSKKTEVNTPGLRKDVQEAIKRSSPEEIKAYIKELRTPGSRMSRYFDNPDLLANVYEDELKKATESKPANKPKVPSSDSAPRVLTGDCKVRIRKETTDGGLPDGSVSHRKDGDYIKKAGKWVPAPAAKGKAGKSPANKPEEKRKFDQRKFGTSPAAKEDAIRASIVERMTPEQREAVMNGRTLRTVKEGQGVIDITKEDLEFFDKHNAERKPTESKPEVKLGPGADNYYFEDPENMSDEDKVFKSLGIELAETFGDHDGRPGNTETWANGWLDNIMDNGGLGIKSWKTRQLTGSVPADEVMRIVEENPARWDRIIGNAMKFYAVKGKSTDFESDEFYPTKLVGGKTKPSAQYYAEGKRNEKNNPLTGKYVTRRSPNNDAAPRQLTGDCKVRIKKS